MRNILKKTINLLALVIFLFFNCDNPTSSNNSNYKNMNGMWTVIKYIETVTDYDAGFVVDSDNYVEFVKDTIESIYLFNDDQCTFYCISRSYSDTGSGECDYLTEYCYTRKSLNVKNNMITGDGAWDSKTVLGVEWNDNMRSYPCTSFVTTRCSYENDTLIINNTEEITCEDNRSTKMESKKYLIPYSGTIPPSNWPEPCEFQ